MDVKYPLLCVMHMAYIGFSLKGMHKMSDIKKEINDAIQDLESKGVNVNSHFQKNNFGSSEDSTKGLGDLVEETLQKFGITEERFKEWFNLKECGCTKRKKWLNGLFSWKVKQKK